MRMKTRLSLLPIYVFIVFTAALAHEGAHVLGTVTKVTPDAVTVLQRNKSMVTVVVPTGTQFTRGAVAAKFSDVKIGDRIAINAVEANGKLTAQTVRFVSAQPPKPEQAKATSAAKPQPSK